MNAVNVETFALAFTSQHETVGQTRFIRYFSANFMNKKTDRFDRFLLF